MIQSVANFYFIVHFFKRDVSKQLAIPIVVLAKRS